MYVVLTELMIGDVSLLMVLLVDLCGLESRW